MFIKQRVTMQLIWEVTDKTFYVLNSTEHEIHTDREN